MRFAVLKPWAIWVMWALPIVLSCGSYSYFESPNHFRNMKGSLHLKNGKSLKGKLVVVTDNMFGSPVKLYEPGDKKPARFDLHDIKGYTVDSTSYEVKEIREPLSIGKRLLFMKRLTPAQSRLHLYEFMRKEIVNKTAVRYHPEYYMQLPGHDESFVFATDGAMFVPNFDKKLSRVVSDCDALAKKIADKEHGYYYHQVNLVKGKRVDVLLRIIEEYNKCSREASIGNGK